MFTGIIEEIGHIRAIKNGVKSKELTISANIIMSDLKLGDSVAVNGVCLTATGISKDSFSADVMHETLNRSSLAALKAGAPVNLERAMAADGRFGGHIVSGHIDGVGKILKIEKDDNAVWYTIEADEKILHYIVEKGSIAIDGISLTVARVGRRDFSVSIIPHTQSRTILAFRAAGDTVNLENDVMGKYIEKLILDRTSDVPAPKSRLDKSFLAQHGYLA